ncbi:MAG: 3D domain-containing protein [Vicinamibacterales bacterium]
MLLTRSTWWKSAVTGVAALAFIWLLEVTIFDARHGAAPLSFFDTGSDSTAPPQPGSKLAFTATAYCKGAVTSSGVPPREGVTAADPSLLPVGSLVDLDFGDDLYDGIYSVLDTGPQVRGRQIDVYIWSCNEALQFGRRPVRMTVLRLGWNPQATTPGFMERLLRRLPAERRTAAPRGTSPAALPTTLKAPAAASTDVPRPSVRERETPVGD